MAIIAAVSVLLIVVTPSIPENLQGQSFAEFEQQPTSSATLAQQFGREVESFDAIRSSEGLDFGTLPSYVPENLRFDSVRSFGERSAVIIYVPSGVLTDNDQTVAEIYERGAIVVSYFSAGQSPEYNKTIASEQYVLHTPNSKLKVINGNPMTLAEELPLVMVNTYDFQAKTVSSVVERTKSQVIIFLDKGMISVQSSSYSLEELARVAEVAVSKTESKV